jgi:hypothetical protein
MTELTKLSKEIVDTSSPRTPAERLREAVRRAVPSAPEAAGPEVALLLDRSGSMYGSPMQKLREAILPFSGIRKFQYADTCEELHDNKEVQEPGARRAFGPDVNNNEPVAFQTLKVAGVRHVVFVTDGGADDEEEALRAAQGLKVDVIYIGPPPPPYFLERLAKATGGRYDGSVTFTAQDGSRQLTSRIRGLLPAPAFEASGPRVIAL